MSLPADRDPLIRLAGWLSACATPWAVPSSRRRCSGLESVSADCGRVGEDPHPGPLMVGHGRRLHGLRL